MKQIAEVGMCRWCGLGILNAKGKRDKRRTWHPECVKLYTIACFSGAQRAACYARDKGKCARCGKTTWHWQADHIRPLIEANGDFSFYTLENLQTLCAKPCHVDKGNEDRARRKGLVPERNMELALA